VRINRRSLDGSPSATYSPGDQQPKLLAVEWVPRKHALIIVDGNDVYFSREIKYDARIERLTSTGEEGVIFNGVPDVGMQGKSSEVFFLFKFVFSVTCT
jgi:hypothetical protein